VIALTPLKHLAKEPMSNVIIPPKPYSGLIIIKINRDLDDFLNQDIPFPSFQNVLLGMQHYDCVVDS
jgi:hypothetical protein